jgi:hypothetical protein
MPTARRPSPSWFARRLVRHVGWARRQGLGRLIEEDDLDPIVRSRLALARWRWRRSHDARPTAIPVFLVGLQRSGTNMLVRGLERSPEFEVRNENDRRAFDRFRLRPDPVIRSLVESSRHRFVLFKPLCDSHRVTELLDGLGTASPGRAIWAYRGVDGRVRSAVAKFGPANLVALREIATGRGSHLWQAGGLGPERIELIRSFDLDRMTPETAAALFWFLRNGLYFDLGLHERDDVWLGAYERFVASPEPTMRSLCGFLGFPFEDRLVAHVDARAASVARVDVDPRVRELCDGLAERLERAASGSPAAR